MRVKFEHLQQHTLMMSHRWKFCFCRKFKYKTFPWSIKTRDGWRYDRLWRRSTHNKRIWYNRAWHLWLVDLSKWQTSVVFVLILIMSGSFTSVVCLFWSGLLWDVRRDVVKQSYRLKCRNGAIKLISLFDRSRSLTFEMSSLSRPLQDLCKRANRNNCSTCQAERGIQRRWFQRNSLEQ